MGEVKFQTILRFSGDLARETAKSIDARRRRALRDATRAAEWYAGYELQKVTGWTDDEIVEAGFLLEPRR